MKQNMVLSKRNNWRQIKFLDIKHMLAEIKYSTEERCQELFQRGGDRKKMK